MRRAYQPHEHRSRERRRLAYEAARLMAESGIRDYQQAKRKAAHRLHWRTDAALPHNREIQAALQEYQRLFAGPDYQDRLRARRAAAAQAMEFFQAFRPRLTGSVLDGTASPHSPVELHLHSDTPEAIQLFLAENGIPITQQTRRIRLDRHTPVDLPLWSFEASHMVFELLILPLQALRQAPLSAFDNTPMDRASSHQLRQLLDHSVSSAQRPAS